MDLDSYEQAQLVAQRRFDQRQFDQRQHDEQLPRSLKLDRTQPNLRHFYGNFSPEG